MKTVFSHLWGLYFYVMRTSMFIGTWAIARRHLHDEKLFPKVQGLRRWGSQVVLKLGGMRLRITGKDKIDWSKTYIVCSNHNTSLDIFIISAIVPGTLSFMGKAELTKVPFMRDYFKTIDIAVERGNAAAAGRSFVKAVQAVTKNRHLVIFPEGGIKPDPKKLHPFKEGAFQIAARKKIPILPITILDAWKIVPDKKLQALPGIITCIFHDPVEAGIEGAEFLKNKVFDIINKPITEHYQ